MVETTLVDLLRHGEPRGGRKYRGQVDDPLSDRGWEQMRSAVSGERPWQAVVTSPLCRCADFARELCAGGTLPLSVEPRLREIGFGSWEGRTRADICADDPAAVDRFLADPIGHAPPGAEPLAAFRDRVVAGWESLLANHRGRHVLVVCHAGVIRLLVAHVLGMPLSHVYRLQVANARFTRIAVDRVSDDLILPKVLFHASRL